MLISIFVSWVLKRKAIADELTSGGRFKVPLLPVYVFILRYIAPVAIFVIFVTSLMGA